MLKHHLSDADMRCIVQRVLNGSVSVDGSIVSRIERGLVVLVGLTTGDTEPDHEYIAKKILTTRLWPGDDDKPWARSCRDAGFPVLLVSQFTLYASLKSTAGIAGGEPVYVFTCGRHPSVHAEPRPDFHHAMAPDAARASYAAFVSLMRRLHGDDKVFDGVFGAMMEVQLVNDGPVTLIVDSADRPNGRRDAAEAPADDA